MSVAECDAEFNDGIWTCEEPTPGVLRKTVTVDAATASPEPWGKGCHEEYGRRVCHFAVDVDAASPEPWGKGCHEEYGRRVCHFAITDG